MGKWVAIMHTVDNLERTLQAMRQKAERGGIRLVDTVFPFAEGHQGYTSYWTADWETYLELGVSLNAPVLYVHVETFNLQEENRAWLDRWRDDRKERRVFSSSSQDEWFLQRLTEATKNWDGYDGQVGYARCLWFKEGVAHFLQLETDWHGEYNYAAEEELDRAHMVEEEMQRARTDEEAAEELQLAKQLARHERFPEATNEEKRKYMARQLFPDYWNPGELANLAATVYWWEVEPEIRSTRAEKVRELYDQGLTIKNIAAALKMPEAKVRITLEGADL